MKNRIGLFLTYILVIFTSVTVIYYFNQEASQNFNISKDYADQTELESCNFDFNESFPFSDCGPNHAADMVLLTPVETDSYFSFGSNSAKKPFVGVSIVVANRQFLI